jgi:hypothetical protein
VQDEANLANAKLERQRFAELASSGGSCCTGPGAREIPPN